ncbi:hypothetical protein CRG98_037204 [Punica granatum]|uniref:Uncharacterized protein n=1 Tax=Punica granatum TaxID=22663 RepID=A0A2I0IEJ7_PUNGR|nr:hypothetical protein CRG98_037204 [Punica granatum]
MELPWFNQEKDSSFSRGKNHKHQSSPLPPKKRFCIKSSLTAWRPDNRQQLILDNLWSSIKNPQKDEESINALVLHMEEQSNSKASLQQELCQKIDSLQEELSLQKAQTHAFLQNSLAEFDNFTEHFAEMQRENHALKKKFKKNEKRRDVLEKENEGFKKEIQSLCEERIEVIELNESCLREKDDLIIENKKLRQELESPSTPSIIHSQESSSTPSIIRSQDEHRPEYQSLFGNNAWDLIKKSLHRSSSLFVSIESSPPEWISPIKVQPAIHYIFISPVNEWHWRKYPEHILKFSGLHQRVFLHISLIDNPVQPGFSTRHDHWLDKFEEEYLLDSQIAHRQY